MSQESDKKKRGREGEGDRERPGETPGRIDQERPGEGEGGRGGEFNNF